MTATRDADELRLDEQLCFALYCATNAVVRAYRPLLARLGLTYPQYVVLMALWERDDVTMSELGERLDLPPHGLTPVLERLQLAGLLARRRDPADRRTVRVRLSAEGAELERRAAQAQHEVVCSTRLSDAALFRLREDLRALAANLSELGPAACSAPSPSAVPDALIPPAARRTQHPVPSKEKR